MVVPYNPNFILTDGVITITWNVRPSSVDYDPRMMVVNVPIPGSNYPRFQNMGHGGYNMEWSGTAYMDNRGTAFPVLYPGINRQIAMAGVGVQDPYNAQEVMNQLRAWGRAGTVLTFTDDEALEFNGGVSLIVKIEHFKYRRIPGHAYDYTYRIILQEYSAGNAI